jgi:hypothetical protein
MSERVVMLGRRILAYEKASMKVAPAHLPAPRMGRLPAHRMAHPPARRQSGTEACKAPCTADRGLGKKVRSPRHTEAGS